MFFLTDNGNVRVIKLCLETLQEDKFEDLFTATGPEEASTFKRMLTVPDSGQALILGKTQPQMWDMGVCTQTWRGKNLPNDDMDLEIPMSDVCGAVTSRNFYTGTDFGSIRLYDPKAQKRPIFVQQADKTVVSNMALSPCGNNLIYSNQIGQIFVTDTRKDLQVIHKLKGSKGSV